MSIKVSHITKIYGTQKALNDVSFEVAEGVIAAFLGPNGAGKSTMMKILTGYIPATSGSASICGVPVDYHNPEIRKFVGYLPESNPLYPDMFVREYLSFLAGIHSISASARQTRIETMITQTGLSREVNKKIGTLSKGYKQRVGLAAAMIHDPKVLILDEPTSGLDPNQLVEIRELISSLGKSKTLLISTHIMKEVETLCEQVIILDKGVIRANDRIDRLRGETGQKFRVLLVEFDKAVNRNKIQQIPGIHRIKSISDVQYVLEVDGKVDLRPVLFQWAVQENCMVLSMSYQTQDMETVFREKTGHGNK